MLKKKLKTKIEVTYDILLLCKYFKNILNLNQLFSYFRLPHELIMKTDKDYLNRYLQKLCLCLWTFIPSVRHVHYADKILQPL